jgi:hypothetical protein
MRDRRLVIEGEERRSKIVIGILLFLYDLTACSSKVLISRMLCYTVFSVLYNKKRKEREYIKRELSKSLKLFLRVRN